MPCPYCEFNRNNKNKKEENKMKNDLTIHERNFIIFFELIQKQVHETAKEKGWWDSPRELGTQLSLFHSEISEGLEALRTNKQSNKIPGFLGIEEELADLIIRVMDTSEKYGYKISEAILAKMKYNEGREYRHGGKQF